MFDQVYTFKGKHAQYVKDLVDIDNANLFPRNIDVYILAPILGFLNGRKGEVDNSDINTKIFAEQLIKEQIELTFIYRVIMLLDNSNDLTAEERIDRAFREESNSEAQQRSIKIFDSYVLGGVEYLHEKLSSNDSIERDDYLEALYDLIERFNEDLASRANPEDIYSIINNYNNI